MRNCIGINRQTPQLHANSPRGNLLGYLILGLACVLLPGSVNSCLSVQERSPRSREELAIPAFLPVSLPEGRLRCGLARVKLTPLKEAPLAGYAARRGRPGQGIHDDLYARALLLDNGQQKVALVATDLLFIPQELREAVIRKIERGEKRLGTHVMDHLLLAATHNHSGLGGYMDNWVFEKAALGPYDREVFDSLVRQLATAVLQAGRHWVPARLGVGRGRARGLNVNRRRKGGPTDPELRMIRVDDEEGKPLAYVVNFSAHPTLLGPKNMQFSAEYPGQLARALEEGKPAPKDALSQGLRPLGSPPSPLAGQSSLQETMTSVRPLVLFFNGSLGDQAPYRAPGYEGFDRVEKLGELLAERVREVSNDLPTKGSIRLGAIGRTVPLPGPDVRGALGRFSFLFNGLADLLFVPDSAYFQLVLVDGALLVALPCEPGVEVGRDLQARLQSRGFPSPWIVAPANNYIGYLIEEEEYRRGGYEARLSFYGPGMAEWVKGKVLELARGMGGPGSAALPGDAIAPYKVQGAN